MVLAAGYPLLGGSVRGRYKPSVLLGDIQCITMQLHLDDKQTEPPSRYRYIQLESYGLG